MKSLKGAKAVVLTIILVVISSLGVSLILQYAIPAFTQTQSLYDIKEAFPNLTFNRPVVICHAGDGSNRLFVVAQQGEIYVFENTENVQNAKLFLDIKDSVLFGGEQGLLGLAFHPNFSSNGFFYVDYTAENPRRTVIARFSVSQDNPDEGDMDSEQVILEVMQPYGNHNGGQIVFGPDGFLYISLGDGGSGGDPLGNGQNRSTLLGSILRIDVDTPSEGIKYSIPADNPFVGNTQGYREEIYAYGLRNPWRFSFDPVTGWLWTGDVGQNRLEEIDIVEKGGNYGWNIMEGSQCYSPSEGCNSTGLELPLWEYGRDFGVSVTGGFVYRGSMLPDLVGAYVYGDFGSGRIWALEYSGVDEPDNRELVDTELSIASFGIDEANELYICAFDEKIYKLTTQATALPEIGVPAHAPNEPTPDQAVSVTVKVTASNGLREVILSYTTNAGWTNVTMSLVTENSYTADMPAMPEETQVNYRIIAYDNL
ncbi:MAG: PQQ-dependent sugar dehydrogenase, partial [Candidatus Bathyarchaeota archaeon]